MKKDESPDTEPVDEEAQQAPPSPKGRQSFRHVRRELTEEELSSPGSQRFLIDELERLEGDNAELRVFREKFHTADKSSGILKEKLTRHTGLEILSSGALIAGALALGYAPNIWDESATGPMLLVIGIILVAAGIWAKAIRA